MMKTKQNPNLLMKAWVTLMAVLVLFTAMAPIKASAHNAYYLSTTLNVTDSRYEPTILYDREGFGEGHRNHRESKFGFVQGYKWEEVKLTSDLEDLKDGKYVTRDLVKNPYLIFTFPGAQNEDGYDGSAEDLARAEWISKTMIQSLNDAIGFIVQETKHKPSKSELIKLGTNLANASVSSGNVTYNDQVFKVTGNTKAPKSEQRKGVTPTGYTKIVSPDGDTRYFVHKVPKGYITLGGDASKAQKKEWSPLASNVPADLKDKVNDGDTKYLTWRQIVLQAHYYAIEHETYYSTIEDVVNPSKLEQYVTDMGNTFMLSLRSMLGLYSFSELMLNEGDRGGNAFFLGIMPISWMDSATILHWTSMILAWMLMFIAFARLLTLRNLSAINIAKRVDLMDGIKSLIVVGFALSMFNPIFYALANFNFLLVDVMKNTSSVTSSFGTASPGSGLLSVLLINGVYLIVEIYFNFIYIARGIAVAVLYGTGPLFIASLAFGGKYAQMFSNYMRELVGNIYVQTFHALLVAFFASVSAFGGLRLFEQLVVLFAFIPLTKFFREATGIGGGLADIGGGAFGAVAGLAQAGTKKMRTAGAKSVNNAKAKASESRSARSSSTDLSTANMKSSTDFQSKGGKATGSMVGNDNLKSTTSQSSSSSNAGGDMSFVDKAKSKATQKVQDTKAGMSNMAKDAVGEIKSGDSWKSAGRQGLQQGVRAAGAVSAIGMAAVDKGSVGQNMSAISSGVKPGFNKASTRHNFEPSRQNQRPPQAPQNMGDYADTGNYEGSEMEGGNFTHKFKQNNDEGYNQMLDEHGINHVEMKGNDLAYTYDYNMDTQSFNSGKYYNSTDNEKMMDMYHAFNGGDETKERRKHYESQGITGVSYGENGMTVTAKAGTNDIQKVATDNNQYRFTKSPGSHSNANLMDAVRTGNERDRRGNQPPKGNGNNGNK